MASIVQLKDSNGDLIYPVTQAEAIYLTNGSTMEAAFQSEKTSLNTTIQTNIEAKKTALASDYSSTKTALQQDYETKKTALASDYSSTKTTLNNDYTAVKNDLISGSCYTGDSPTYTSYPVGSIILTQYMASGVCPINQGYDVYYNSSAARFFSIYKNGGSDLENILSNKGITTYFMSKVSGDWRSRGTFKDSNENYALLLQKVSN